MQNTSKRLRPTWRSTVAGLALTIATATTAMAQQEPSDLQIASRQEVGNTALQAAEYGYSGKGVGIEMLIGRDIQDEIDNIRQLEDAAERLLKKHGAPSEQFAVYTDMEATQVTFYTQTETFGPYSLQGAMDNAQRIANEYKLEQDTHQHLSIEK